MLTEETIQSGMPETISTAGLETKSFSNPAHFMQKHLSKQKKAIGIVLGIGIVHSIVSFLLTLMVGEFFMLQFNTGSSKGKLLEWLGLTINNLNQFFVLLLLFLILKLITQYLEKYMTLRQGEQFVQDVRNELFISQIKSSEEIFKAQAYGNYLLRYSNDMKAIQQYLTKGILAGVRDLLFVLIGLSFFFLLNPVIGAIVSAYLVAAAGAMFVLAHRQQSVIRASRNKRSNLLAFVTRSFQRFSSMKGKGQDDKVVDRFLHKSDELFMANIHNAKWESMLESIVGFLHIALIGVLLGFIALGIISVHASDGLSCILLLLLLQGTVKRLFKVPSTLKKGSISLEKITSLLNNKR